MCSVFLCFGFVLASFSLSIVFWVLGDVKRKRKMKVLKKVIISGFETFLHCFNLGDVYSVGSLLR